jgi:hypothetical protein
MALIGQSLVAPLAAIDSTATEADVGRPVRRERDGFAGRFYSPLEAHGGNGAGFGQYHLARRRGDQTRARAVSPPVDAFPLSSVDGDIGARPVEARDQANRKTRQEFEW